MEKTEYITREEAKMSHCNACSWYGTCTDETMCEDVKAILTIPASDVRPVVYGKWMNEEQEGFNVFSAECDQCGKRTLAYFHYNFCPNCGAQMNGGNETL